MLVVPFVHRWRRDGARVNRQERRRLARGVARPGRSSAGWVEVCLGVPACGCVEADGPQGGGATEDRPHSPTTSGALEAPVPSAGVGTVVGSSGRWNGREGALEAHLRPS